MDGIFNAMSDHWGWTMIGGVAVTAIVFGTVKHILVAFAREKTRREIAAYIAEGTMTPDQGERLLKATPHDSNCC